MDKVAIVGLGYVGLPLALLAEEKGFSTIGIEQNTKKLAQLHKKISGVDDDFVKSRMLKTRILFTDDPEKVKDRDIVIICVPTPVDAQKNPDLSLVKDAVSQVVPSMKKGSLLVIESTINPGVCDEIITPLVHAISNHIIGETLHLAHCPERINPGDPKWNVSNINRVVGASTDEGLKLAVAFYENLVDAKIKPMGSIKEAEAVKIVENTFRDINIAFVNELAMSFGNLGINVKNVIDGAATKPFAFMAHYPGIGVGGHCIPVDPYYLIEYARNNGFDHKFLSLARSINESMPVYSVDILEKTLIERTGKSLKDSKVAVLGLSYKANVGDDRESPAYIVIDALKARGAEISAYDPHITNELSAPNLDDALNNANAAILVTAHREFINLSVNDLSNISVLLDGRNALHKNKSHFDDHGITYIGLGSN